MFHPTHINRPSRIQNRPPAPRRRVWPIALGVALALPGALGTAAAPLSLAAAETTPIAVAGRIIGSDGAPVAGLKLTLRWEGGNTAVDPAEQWAYDKTVATDAAGLFQAEAPAGTRWNVAGLDSAALPEWQRLSRWERAGSAGPEYVGGIRGLTAGAPPVTYRLTEPMAAPATVTLTIPGAKTGATVEVSNTAHNPDRSPFADRTNSPALARAHVAVKRVAAAKTVVLQVVPGQKYHAYYRGDSGHLPTDRTFTAPAAGQSAAVAVASLDPTVGISGRAVLANGQPARGTAYLVAECEWGSYPSDSFQEYDWIEMLCAPIRSVKTDAKGGFAFKGVPPRSASDYAIAVGVPGYNLTWWRKGGSTAHTWLFSSTSGKIQPKAGAFGTKGKSVSGKKITVKAKAATFSGKLTGFGSGTPAVYHSELAFLEIKGWKTVVQGVAQGYATSGSYFVPPVSPGIHVLAAQTGSKCASALAAVGRAKAKTVNLKARACSPDKHVGEAKAKIAGTRRVGQTLKLTVGQAKHRTKGLKVSRSYIWFAGTEIVGRSKSLRLTAAMRGKAINAVVVYKATRVQTNYLIASNGGKTVG
jgi:hypothetical protein